MNIEIRIPDPENQHRIRSDAEAEGIKFVSRTEQQNALIMARHNIACALGYWDELEKEQLRSYIEVCDHWLTVLEASS